MLSVLFLAFVLLSSRDCSFCVVPCIEGQMQGESVNDLISTESTALVEKRRYYVSESHSNYKAL